jgi:hypothetical protein
MPPTGIGEAMLQSTICCEYQQAFTIGIKAASGINARLSHQ